MLWDQSIIHRFIQASKLCSINIWQSRSKKIVIKNLNVLQLFYQVW